MLTNKFDSLSKLRLSRNLSFIDILTENDSPETDIDNDEDDAVLLLTESDIPGASLDGKDPSELNVPQLKRWLNCRGAPVNGKKPELIQR